MVGILWRMLVMYKSEEQAQLDLVSAGLREIRSCGARGQWFFVRVSASSCSAFFFLQ